MQPIPWTFIRERTRLSWRDAAWGYHNACLGWSDVVQFACDRLATGEDDAAIVELASLSKSDAHEAGKFLDKLALRLGDGDEASTKAKWLYLNLAWLFENRLTCDDPLEAVEMIYADFDYPEEVAPFVRYMPVADGYDPGAHSAEANEARLLAKWRNYLNTKARIFAPTPERS